MVNSRQTPWRKCLLLCLLSLVPLIALICFGTLLGMFLMYLLFFVAAGSPLIAIAISMAWINREALATRPLAVEPSTGPSSPTELLPAVPRTLSEAIKMNPEEFELLSAAVLLSLGEGYTFIEHCGKGGKDQGVDILLRNKYQQYVVAQCKRNAEDNPSGSPKMREFLGSIAHYDAVYGYFVTTSTFTNDAIEVVHKAGGRIRMLNGIRLHALLQHRHREIALAYRDILAYIRARQKSVI